MLGLLFAMQVGLTCWSGWRPVSPSPRCLRGLEWLGAPWVGGSGKEEASVLRLEYLWDTKAGKCIILIPKHLILQIVWLLGWAMRGKRQPVLAGNEDFGGWIFTAENSPLWAEVHNYRRWGRFQFSWRNYSAGLRVTQQKEKGNAVIISLPQESRR